MLLDPDVLYEEALALVDEAQQRARARILFNDDVRAWVHDVMLAANVATEVDAPIETLWVERTGGTVASSYGYRAHSSFLLLRHGEVSAGRGPPRKKRRVALVATKRDYPYVYDELIALGYKSHAGVWDLLPRENPRR